MTKYLVPGISGLFLILLGLSFYVSIKHYEGLVEDGYSEKAAHYFEKLKKEMDLGLEIRVSEGLEPFEVWIKTKRGLLRKAKVILKVGRIDRSEDLRFDLKEVSDGHYSGMVQLPRKGFYMFNLEVSKDDFKTNRRWFKRIE